MLYRREDFLTRGWDKPSTNPSSIDELIVSVEANRESVEAIGAAGVSAH
jgi:hypothetical protein